MEASFSARELPAFGLLTGRVPRAVQDVQASCGFFEERREVHVSQSAAALSEAAVISLVTRRCPGC